MVTSASAFLRILRPIGANIVGLPRSRSFASSPTSMAERKKTCLHEVHVSHGGKMCDFAGYSMPTQYGGESITESHSHTRFVSALFCVKQMLENFSGGIKEMCYAFLKLLGGIMY